MGRTFREKVSLVLEVWEQRLGGCVSIGFNAPTERYPELGPVLNLTQSLHWRSTRPVQGQGEKQTTLALRSCPILLPAVRA